MKKILFVCLGNICRSPAAEAIFNRLLERNGASERYYTESAGTSGYHEGALPDPRMRLYGEKRGLKFVTRSRPLVRNDLENFDLIIPMDQSNYSNILKLDSKGNFASKVKMMLSFSSQRDYQEVPDPYHGGDDGFDLVLDLLEEACEGLLNHQEKS